MNRMVAMCVVMALLLILAGCDGGGALGVPADAAPPKPIDLSQKFSMTKAKKGARADRASADPARGK